MTPRIVDGKIGLVVSRDRLLEGIDRVGSPRVEFTVESMADSICTVFCAPRKLRPSGGLALEIHRRQHIEIAKSIIDAKGA